MQQQDFQTAQAMAQVWIRQRTDPNEVAKSLRYLTEHQDGRRFFRYLRTVVQEGRAVVRSGRSLDYYRQIEQVCHQHLASYDGDPKRMAQILGWAVRLMRYYAVEPDLTPPQPPSPPTTPKEHRVPAPPKERPHRIQDLSAGMVLKGTVRKLQPYGAFVDIGVGRDGLVHISELADHKVSAVEEVVKVGDEVTVKVINVDMTRNRIGLTMKGLAQ